ncbi:uncharacterized protein LACBIDRAFT_327817 [Laccaria bicolor S238N-H82]|uniref:Predicted protein n=1 Tax=Laccaria bicolor (strain S238N-H82 / ATCC MYA-4686) TaxID=486041 RepID=B0DCX5_LACBS|nr:uncharacterized protein LACBIDRAFT_327817 [Laccaria bicolor S238N-H82]EDR07375.1 predicted protein [Laccaria bicolor S238N-H82]|eukprot:XP_001881767.1 predicted protein [Laccaria bicolor S238N-H82]
MLLGHFRLNVTVPGLDPVATHQQQLSVIGSDDAHINFHISLPPSEHTGIKAMSPYGSFVSDSHMSKYNMLWGSRCNFELFLAQEQSLHSVEFLKSQTITGLSGKYLACESYLPYCIAPPQCPHLIQSSSLPDGALVTVPLNMSLLALNVITLEHNTLEPIPLETGTQTCCVELNSLSENNPAPHLNSTF